MILTKAIGLSTSIIPFLGPSVTKNLTKSNKVMWNCKPNLDKVKVGKRKLWTGSDDGDVCNKWIYASDLMLRITFRKLLEKATISQIVFLWDFR